MPGFLAPWINAVRQHPASAAAVLAALLVSLRFSSTLQGRICDRARAAWIARTRVDRLKPTGERGALLETMLWFVGFATGAWVLRNEIQHYELWIAFFAAGAVVFGVWWAFRLGHPAKSIDPAKPGFFLSVTRKVRTTGWTVNVYRFAAETAAPVAFLALTTIAAGSLAQRVVFDVASAGGAYCTGAELDVVVEKVGTYEKFKTSSMCHPTGLWLIKGRKYRISLDMDKGLSGEWFDKGIRTDVAGFAADSVQHFTASPLKRWWFENWFQPVARIGKVGNYEHVLKPAAPLPVVDFKKCAPADGKHLSPREALLDIPLPAAEDYKRAQLECEAGKAFIKPNRTLISDITADANGELFIYVNDAVLTFPGLTELFYNNNGGTAKVTVTRILAESVLEEPSE